MKSNVGYAFLAIVGAFTLWGAWNLVVASYSPQKFQMSSLNDKKRTTELGNPTKQDKNGEQNVIMYDPTMAQKWGLLKTDTPKAWRISKGCKDVTVAIIDTGIDMNHPDLKDSLWTNPGESGLDKGGRDKSKNGVDDDNNGYIDDIHGWNFVDNNNDLSDHHGHGSHIAGIIGAQGKKAVGIAPNSSLMILKYYDPKSPGMNNLKNTIRAIHYATKMGARIINYSGGGVDYSNEEFQAIKEARAHGILFVAAAGNERTNSDKNPYYPANYHLDNIISVTAIDPRLKILPSSNYGVQTVDIAAPGEEIFSTLPNGSYGTMTGTSQATAFVTGVSDLVMCNNKSLTATETRKYILATGDEEPSLFMKTGTSKRLDSYKALSKLDQGLGLTGVKALNTLNMKPSDFSSDPQAHLTQFSEPDVLSSFGKNLMQSIEKTGITGARN